MGHNPLNFHQLEPFEFGMRLAAKEVPWVYGNGVQAVYPAWPPAELTGVDADGNSNLGKCSGQVMRWIRQSAFSITAVVSLLLLSGCQTASDDAGPAANSEVSKAIPADITQTPIKTITIPAGTEIQARLVDTVGSARSRAGENFLATLDQPIVVNDWVAVPRGTNITGRVVVARPSGHLKTPAALAVTLTALQVNGMTYEIKTWTYSCRGQSHVKRNIEWVGGSAAGSALPGAPLGRGKGAAMGAAAGAAGGTAAAYATGQKDILLPAETRLRFVLQQPVTVTKAG